MGFSKPVVEVIKARYSVRTYQPIAIEGTDRARLAEAAGASQAGPFGNRPRFEVLAASEEDREALKGLGTYGFIKGPAGFLVGASREADHNLEDFGFLMERLILLATDLGLGSCWLGGTFTKSRFADKVNLWKHPTLQGPEAVEEAGFPEEWEVSNNLPLSYLISPKGHLVWKQKASVTKEILSELFAKAKETREDDKEKLREYFKPAASNI